MIFARTASTSGSWSASFSFCSVAPEEPAAPDEPAPPPRAGRTCRTTRAPPPPGLGLDLFRDCVVEGCARDDPAADEPAAADDDDPTARARGRTVPTGGSALRASASSLSSSRILSIGTAGSRSAFGSPRWCPSAALRGVSQVCAPAGSLPSPTRRDAGTVRLGLAPFRRRACTRGASSSSAKLTAQ